MFVISAQLCAAEVGHGSQRLHIEKGDLLYISETPGGVQSTPYKPEFARVVEAGRRATRKYRNTLRKLAE
jgi:hypothetical protein